MSIRFEAKVALYIEVDLPDDYFEDDEYGLTAREYISKHIDEYRDQIANNNTAWCMEAREIEGAE